LVLNDEILQECIKGNPAAQSKLYKMFANKMLGVCMRYCNSEDDAKDVMQEGFVKVFNTLSKFQGNSSVSTWITRIMMNTAIDHFRKHQKHQMVTSLDNMVVHLPSVNEEALGKLTYDEIIRAIQDLSPGYRTVFNLFIIEGLSHEEISNHLGISTGTSKSNLSKARRQLQQILFKKNEISIAKNAV